jgi:hypothetical protein
MSGAFLETWFPVELLKEGKSRAELIFLKVIPFSHWVVSRRFGGFMSTFATGWPKDQPSRGMTD